MTHDDSLHVHFKRVRPHTLPIPARARALDSGLDLRLDLSDPTALRVLMDKFAWQNAELMPEGLRLRAGALVPVPTGWAMELPPGYEAVTRGRSGLAFNHHITVGHVGTIDAGYRGEIIVLLQCINSRGASHPLKHGERIAQLVINKIPLRIVTDEVQRLNDSERGERGFGSTGV